MTCCNCIGHMPSGLHLALMLLPQAGLQATAAVPSLLAPACRLIECAAVIRSSYISIICLHTSAWESLSFRPSLDLAEAGRHFVPDPRQITSSS